LDQFYFESGYLEDRYFAYIANAEAAPYIQAEYIDRYFWQDGTLYIDAELIGEGQILEGEDVFADAFVSAAFTINCQGNVTFSAASTLSAEFTQQAMISHIEGADLFAFAEAQMAIEVSRLRDHNIVASTVFDVATDVVRIKQSDVDLISQVESSILGDKVRLFAITAQAAFAFAATANMTASITRNLASAFTLAYRKRPWEVKRFVGTDGTARLTFSPGGQLGTSHNLSFNNSEFAGLVAFVDYFVDDSVSINFGGNNNDLVVEFWILPNSISTFNNFMQFRVGSTTRWSIAQSRANNIPNILFRIGPLTSQSTFLSGNLIDGSWNHVVLSLRGDGPSTNGCALFVNGQRVATIGGLGTGYGADNLRLTTGTGGGGFRLDELRFLSGPSGTLVEQGFSPSLTSIPVPTERRWNSDSTRTTGLFHFDNSFADDIGIKYQLESTMSAQVTVQASITTPVLATAGLSSTVILTAELEKLKLADADLDSESIVAADINVIADGLSNQTAETTIDLTVSVIRNLESELNTAAELSAIISHIEGADIVADSFAALDADVEKITESDISIQSEFAQDTDAESLLDGVAAFETTADIEISSVVIADAVSALNSEFAQDTDVLRLRDLSSSLDSESNLAVEVNYTAESPAQLDSESQLSTDAGRIQQGEIFTESVATKLAIVVKVGSVVLDIPVVSDLAVDIVGTLEAQADLASEFTFTGSGTGRAQAEAHLFAQALQVTDAEATKPFDSAMFSEFDIFARGIKDTELVLDIASESSLAADSDKFVGVSSDLLSEFTQTSTEDLFKAFDSALTSTVELDITAAKTAWAESSIDTEFNLDCTISHIEGADIVADSFAELDIEFFVGRVGSGDLQAETEITVANDRIRDHDSSQTTEASIFAEILRLRDFSTDLTADTVQTAAVNAILSADSSSISTTELFCIISHIEGADIVADSFAELEITANIIKGVSSDLIAAATLDAQAMVLVGLSSDQTVTATVAADAMVMFSLTGNLNSAFSQTALGGVIEQLSADLVASGGLLAVGRDIRLDTKVYVIPPETRIYSIAAETRIDSIDSETRIFTIRSTR
jgi:hypothetical protein